jgi:hypothetical protein
MANTQRAAELNLNINNQSQQTNSAAKKELAIVSPCSTCQNFTQSSSSNPYRSACPRRIWINQNQQNPDDPTTVDPVLYLSGTDDPNTLNNPVVDQSTGNYLVWVAAIEDNPGIFDSAGNVVTVGILDPNFNNLYIRCRANPYVSEQHHDILRSLGAFQQSDHVVAEEHRMPALNPNVVFTNDQIPFTSTPIAGTVAKTSFAYFFNTTNPNDHALVGGC